MDTTINVQHSKHFKIDPAKLNIGDIQLPDPIMKTTVVGDEIISKKIPLNEAFTGAEQEELKKQLEPLVIKAHQTATHVAETPSVPAVTPQSAQQTTAPTAPVPAAEEEGESLFD